MRAAASLCLLLGMATILDAAEPRLVAGFKGSTEDISGVAFYPDAKTLATSSRDGTVRLWDWEHGLELETLTSQEHGFHALASAPDGSALAASDGWGKITLWVKGQKKPAVLDNGKPINPLAFSADGKLLAAGGPTLWDVTTGKMLERHFDEAVTFESSLAITRDGKRIATLAGGGAFGVWSVSGRREMIATLPGAAGLRALALTPNGRTIAVSGWKLGESFVELWDGHSRRAKLPCGTKEILWRLVFSPNGRLLAGTGDAGVVTLWDMRTRKEPRKLALSGKLIRCLAFSADGKWLAVGDTGGAVRVWEMPEEFRGRLSDLPLFEQSDLLRTKAGLRCLALRPDGKELALGADDNWIEVWEVGKDAPRLTLKGHRKAVTALAYSPDGKTLLSAGLDGTARLWDAATGRQRVGCAATTGRYGAPPLPRTARRSPPAAQTAPPACGASTATSGGRWRGTRDRCAA